MSSYPIAQSQLASTLRTLLLRRFFSQQVNVKPRYLPTFSNQKLELLTELIDTARRGLGALTAYIDVALADKHLQLSAGQVSIPGARGQTFPFSDRIVYDIDRLKLASDAIITVRHELIHRLLLVVSLGGSPKASASPYPESTIFQAILPFKDSAHRDQLLQALQEGNNLLLQYKQDPQKLAKLYKKSVSTYKPRQYRKARSFFNPEMPGQVIKMGVAQQDFYITEVDEKTLYGYFTSNINSLIGKAQAMVADRIFYLHNQANLYAEQSATTDNDLMEAYVDIASHDERFLQDFYPGIYQDMLAKVHEYRRLLCDSENDSHPLCPTRP